MDDGSIYNVSDSEKLNELLRKITYLEAQKASIERSMNILKKENTDLNDRVKRLEKSMNDIKTTIDFLNKQY